MIDKVRSRLENMYRYNHVSICLCLYVFCVCGGVDGGTTLLFSEGLSVVLCCVPGPFNHLKSSLLGSNSDSNIHKYSTINKIPLIGLNFTDANDRKAPSPPSSEKTIIAPKVKDRTHNVTEKVTQVRGVCDVSIVNA